MRSNSSASCRSGQCHVDSTSFAVEAVSRLMIIGGLCGATLAAAAPLWAAPASSATTVNDAKGPIVSILQPQYSDQLKGAVSVLIGVESRKFTPQTVEMFVDGLSQTVGPVALPSLPSANFSWDTTRHPDGPHKLTVVVTDTQGFRGSSEVTVYINNNRQRDLAPPTLQWLNAKNGDTWRGEVKIDLKVVDNFGVKYLFVSLNPSSDPLKKPASASWFLNVPPYTVPFDSRKVPDGLYTLRALAFDALENEGSAPSLQIGIANNSINPTPFRTPPNLTLPIPKPSQSPIPAPSPATPIDPSSEASVASNASKPDADNEPIRTQNDTTVGGSTESNLPPRANTNDLIARGQRPSTLRQPSTSASVSGSREGSRSTAASRATRSADAGQAMSRPSTSRQIVTRPSLAPRVAARPSGNAAPASSEATLSAQNNLKAETRITIPSEPVARAVKNRAQNGASSPSGASLPARVATLPATPRGSIEPEMATMVTQRLNGSVAAHATTRSGNGSSAMRPGKLVAPSGAERATTSATNAKETTLAARATRSNRSGSNRSRVAPMSPQSLPGRESGLSAWMAQGQGSVAAPVLPTLPNPNLVPNRAPLRNRASLPHLAALPDLAPHNRSQRAAITVTPAQSGLAVQSVPIVHIAQRDETLAAIARRYKLPVAVLATHNKLSHGARVKTGHKVLLPQPLVVTYQGRPVTGDVASMMVGSMGVTPFRFLFEKQGGKLHWDGKTGRVTARNATHQVTLTIGSEAAVVNKKDVMMDLAAFLLSGRTMVPIRFFEKALQAKVEWEPATGRLFVAMAN